MTNFAKWLSVVRSERFEYSKFMNTCNHNASPSPTDIPLIDVDLILYDIEGKLNLDSLQLFESIKSFNLI